MTDHINTHTTCHPDYGLPDKMRMEILDFAARHSVREAAEVYHVGPSSIYYWRNQLIEGTDDV